VFFSSLTSLVSQAAHPFFILFAWLLATFFALVPNYVFAIALLTIAVMIVVYPITLRGTRSMMKMQLLAPELKRIQTRFKSKPSASVAERQESRQRLNEEMMALYQENGVSPTGGCLTMFLQFPIFIILYDTIKGLIHTVTQHGHVIPLPRYVSSSSKLYHAVAHGHGALQSFGINLADSVRTTGLSFGTRLPLIALILVAIALQYIQMKQLSGRNPTAANPQMQKIQRLFPIIFAIIYIAIPAAVNVYFIVSSLFRVLQQEYMYRRDPHIRASMARLREAPG